MPARRTRGLLTLACFVLALASASRADAQCGAKQSTCAACHDGARAPYSADAHWHADHAFASVCAVCHGGNADADARAAAHVGLAPPLEDGASACVSCHGAASAGLAQRYTTARSAADAGEGAGGSAESRTPPPQPPPVGLRSNDVPAGLLASLLAVLGLGWVVVRERTALRRWRESWMRGARTSPPGGRS